MKISSKTKLIVMKRMESSCVNFLHDVFGVPYNGIGVKMLCWVEPEVEPFLSSPLSLGEHVSVKSVRRATFVAQEL